MTVRELIAPQFDPAPDRVTPNDRGKLSKRLSYALPGATDNAGAPVVAGNPPPGSTFPIGTTRVSCRATDGSGNTVSTSFDIVVKVVLCRRGTRRGDRMNGTRYGDFLCGGGGRDRIRGRGGNDLLRGDRGNDVLIPGPGKDRVAGGKDLIKARDGAKDVIACGGGVDTVIADARDVVPRNCEVVRRPS